MPVTTERIVELVDSRRQDSLRYNQKTFEKVLSWYHTFRGVWQGRGNQFRNNISIPFTYAMIWSDVARKVQTTFGAWPIVSFEGYAPEDIPLARKREVLISAQMKDADSVMRAVDFYLQADICGTAIARVGWKNITRKQRYVTQEPIAPGINIPVLHQGNVTMFNGPVWEPVDRLDFWQQPGRKRIDDMQWVIHRYWADLDDLMEDSRGPYPYFDAPAVRSLKDHPLQGTMHADFNQRRLTFRNEYDYMARTSERFGKPVEIWEMHGTVPDEFAPDGVRHRCIAIGNSRVVLKNRESTLPNGRKPFRSYSPTQDPYGFDGIGKAEIASRPQTTVDRIANQKLDAIDLLIDPMWVASSQSNLNFQNLFTRAGRVLLVDGAADESNLRALQPNMQGLSAAYQEIGQLWQFMQLGSGETEALLGANSSGTRETARGFLGRQENALTRLALESTVAEQGFIEPLANDFVEYDRMFLPTPHQVRMIGSISMTNPITGMPYPAERIEIGPEDLRPDYRARAVGASQMMGRSVRQQNFLQLLQVLSANPAMMQLVNWANFARQAFDLFDFKNVDELLVNQVPLVNSLAAQTGVSPEAMAATAATPLERLDPQILSQLFNSQQASPMPQGV